MLEAEAGQLGAALCHPQPQQVTESPGNGHIFKRNVLLLQEPLREEQWGGSCQQANKPTV